MTLNQLFTHADSRELGLWIALYIEEAEHANLQGLAAKADAAMHRKR